MTHEEFALALEALGWTAGGLSVKLHCSRNLPAKWADGRAAIPVPVGEWLTELAEVHQSRPAPQNWRVRAIAD